ncbi:hypothetical protein MtrunA17_Chr3g0137151 [Medicago truncatula]|uniref:Transmembrane protein, putative n=1 Tax=Medicago truncatula TaxID=3880 RepID=G7J9W7_MEDTR|nr:transmembrane protein, putative [Medicago truncatula]RHN70588.1 hypothetical protein MtrunA17_Chr3g0137151 [Medicago truncatula]
MVSHYQISLTFSLSLSLSLYLLLLSLPNTSLHTVTCSSSSTTQSAPLASSPSSPTLLPHHHRHAKLEATTLCLIEPDGIIIHSLPLSTITISGAAGGGDFGLKQLIFNYVCFQGNKLCFAVERLFCYGSFSGFYSF